MLHVATYVSERHATFIFHITCAITQEISALFPRKSNILLYSISVDCSQHVCNLI